MQRNTRRTYEARPSADELQEYALNRKIELTRDDLRFMRLRMSGLPHARLQELLRRYFDVWLATSGGSQQVKEQNGGRRAANTWLREYFDGPDDCSLS